MDEAVFKPAQRPRPSREAAENAVRTLIEWAGDDPDREGLTGPLKIFAESLTHLSI
jgi:GTP cyclohydrolase IA